MPVVEEWRELTKLLNTYLLPLPALIDPADGRLHTTINQAVAATGRLSTTNPNLQSIPVRTDLGRRIRSAFVAADGTRLLSADYSQVELRILAHVSGEPVLRDAFARGEDIHAATASQVFGVPQGELSRGQRDTAKMVNFGIVYGISSFGLSENLGIPREEAQQLIDTYLARLPRVQELIKRTIAQAAADGYVTTRLGRRRPIPELRASNRQTRSLGERLAVNTVMQGTAADVIKVAMVRIHERLRAEGRAARLVLQVHDELLLEVPEVETSAVRELVRDEMVGAYPLDQRLDRQVVLQRVAAPFVLADRAGFSWGGVACCLAACGFLAAGFFCSALFCKSPLHADMWSRLTSLPKWPLHLAAGLDGSAPGRTSMRRPSASTRKLKLPTCHCATGLRSATWMVTRRGKIGCTAAWATAGRSRTR